MFNPKVFLAEFIGTFALTFIGAGAGISGAGLVAVALAHGFTLAVFVYAFGHISGTHVNPAVTFALWLNGTVKLGEAAFYWIAQFLGAIVAAFLLQAAVSDISGGATVGSLTTARPIFAMVVESVLTFFLVNTVLHTAVAGHGEPFAGWAIGTTLAFAILAGGPLTGASLNPARTFGPAIFSAPSYTSVYTYLIYLFGPLIGATLAVIVYNYLNGRALLPALNLGEKPAAAEFEKTKPKAKRAAARKAR